MAVFTLQELALTKSNFSREVNVQYGEKERTSVNLNSSAANTATTINCVLMIQISSEYEGEKQFDMDIEYSGIFDYKDASKKEIDDFTKFNGPAIIFPFVREHISMISLKGGLRNILLPPINFIELAKEQQDER